MRIRHLLVSLLVAAPLLCAADQKTEKALTEILREIGDLQDQLKAVQKSLDTHLTQLGQSNADQTHASADQTAKAVAALGDRVSKGLQDGQEQQAKTLAAVAGLSSQVKSLSDDLTTMREAMSDLTSSVGKLSTRIGDLNNTVQALQMAATVPVKPQISAADLFASAENDRLSAKFDMALSEFGEFVAKFPDSDQAADAECNIGKIHYSRSEWDDAVTAFDKLLKDHPGSKREAEALFYKADSLARSGHRPEADAVRKDLQKRYPTSSFAKQPLSGGKQ